MPEKPKFTKKKSPATPAHAVKVATSSKARSGLKVAKTQRKPAAGAKRKNAAETGTGISFAEAQRAAIDELVAAIEAAEVKLLELKRATRHEELSTNGALK
jgi:hypothetical protein